MKKLTTSALALALMASGFAATGALAEKINKTYIRKGTEEVRVFTVEGKLYCRRTSDDFEMCYGMEQQPDGTWKGNQMRHPMMGKMMTFDGTVVIGSNKKMSIKGCQLGGLFCDSEVWDEK
ncbi:MAG: DUF2147 domain-containing protein [Paracoccaceae bacterium]